MLCCLTKMRKRLFLDLFWGQTEDAIRVVGRCIYLESLVLHTYWNYLLKNAFLWSKYLVGTSTKKRFWFFQGKILIVKIIASRKFWKSQNPCNECIIKTNLILAYFCCRLSRNINSIPAFSPFFCCFWVMI